MTSIVNVVRIQYIYFNVRFFGRHLELLSIYYKKAQRLGWPET
jgi:hypothetical protein